MTTYRSDWEDRRSDSLEYWMNRTEYDIDRGLVEWEKKQRISEELESREFEALETARKWRVEPAHKPCSPDVKE